MSCFKFEIIVHPTEEEPHVQSTETKKGKIWRWPWRINMLALPKRPISKYTPTQLLVKTSKTLPPLDPNVSFRSEQLAQPNTRTLYENKKLFVPIKGHKYALRMDKFIGKSWDTIYNYYKKKLRTKKLQHLKRLQKKMKDKKLKQKDAKKLEEERKERELKLATPKKLFLPEEIIRKRVALDDIMGTMEKLATPVQRTVIQPRPIGVVSEAALTYDITEPILKLYTSALEKLKKRTSEPRMLGTVARRALTAKCTPRIEKLAQPSFSARAAKKKEEDMYDPWVIPKKALQYKATARTLELAKPLERN